MTYDFDTLRPKLEAALREAAAKAFADPIMKAATWPETKERMGVSHLFVIAATEAVLPLLANRGREGQGGAGQPEPLRTLALEEAAQIVDKEPLGYRTAAEHAKLENYADRVSAKIRALAANPSPISYCEHEVPVGMACRQCANPSVPPSESKGDKQ